MEPLVERHEREVQYVVLSRACANMYDEMVRLFAEWPDVVVVVERRKKRRDVRQHPELTFSHMRRAASGSA
jgi:hypothetical protein